MENEIDIVRNFADHGVKTRCEQDDEYYRPNFGAGGEEKIADSEGQLYYSFYLDAKIDAFIRWKYLQNRLRPLLDQYPTHTLKEVKCKVRLVWRIPMFGYDEFELITFVLRKKTE